MTVNGSPDSSSSTLPRSIRPEGPGTAMPTLMLIWTTAAGHMQNVPCSTHGRVPAYVSFRTSEVCSSSNSSRLSFAPHGLPPPPSDSGAHGPTFSRTLATTNSAFCVPSLAAYSNSPFCSTFRGENSSEDTLTSRSGHL